MYLQKAPKMDPKSRQKSKKTVQKSPSNLEVVFYRFFMDFGLHFGGPGAFRELAFSDFFGPWGPRSQDPPPRAPETPQTLILGDFWPPRTPKSMIFQALEPPRCPKITSSSVNASSMGRRPWVHSPGHGGGLAEGHWIYIHIYIY